MCLLQTAERTVFQIFYKILLSLAHFWQKNNGFLIQMCLIIIQNQVCLSLLTTECQIIQTLALRSMSSQLNAAVSLMTTSSQPQCCLGYGVMTFSIPCQGGSLLPPPPSLPSSPPLPPMPASAKLLSPCWAPDTAELFSQHQEPKGQNLSCSQQAYGEKTLFPFVPCLLGCRFLWVFSLIARHWGWRWGGRRDAAACEAQGQPGPSWCTAVRPSGLPPCLHGTERKGGLSGEQHSGREVAVWRLVPAAWCYSWPSWKMAGKSP